MVSLDYVTPDTTWALIAAKPRTQAMIQDAVFAGFLPEQSLETRLAAVIETVTSTYLSALDDEDKATAKLCVQKATQAADEAWQQTIGGWQRPKRHKPDHRIPRTSQQCSGRRYGPLSGKSQLSAPQLQAQLSRSTDRTRLRRLKNTLLSTPGPRLFGTHPRRAPALEERRAGLGQALQLDPQSWGPG